MRLKSRLCPNGNRDNMKDNLRKYSSTAPFYIIRVLVSLSVAMGLNLGFVDNKGVYLQSGRITQEIYARPLRQWVTKRGVL